MHPLSRLALVFLVACLGQPAWADDLAEASAFISDLYRGYEGQGQRPKRGDPRWYDVSLIRLLTENEKANSDAVPFVSGDPLCNCMEVSGLKVGEVKAMRDEGGRLAGEAKLQFPGDRLERIRLTLIRTPDGLRIWISPTTRCRACARRWPTTRQRRSRTRPNPAVSDPLG